MTDTISKIERVPFVFRMPDNNHYPISNTVDFENWFSQNIKSEEIKSDRNYLGVFWTSYYKGNCNYGNNKTPINTLQEWLDKLDTSKNYFSICQFDDGVLNRLGHLDIKIFSMAGGRKDYGLPLICQPTHIKFDVNRDIFASFVGRLTHPLRDKMISSLIGGKGYYLNTRTHDLASYCSVMARSVFTLAPRGYSANSFRIQEALEYGSIPVWISDSFLPIHDLDFNTFGVVIKSEDIGRIDEILRAFTDEEIKHKQSLLKYIFENYFQFESNKRLILDNL